MKRLTSLFASLFFVAAFMLTATLSFAQDSVRLQISQLSVSAMADYDNFEYESSIQKLVSASKIIKDNNISDSYSANVYIATGIVEYTIYKDSDETVANERAYQAFAKAVEMYENIRIPDDYRIDELDAILQKVKEDFENSKLLPPIIQHTPITTTSPCTSLTIPAGVFQEKIAKDSAQYKVLLHYRGTADTAFKTIPMTGNINVAGIASPFAAVIPAADTATDKISYYIEVVAPNDIVQSTSATANQPYVIEMVGSCTDETLIAKVDDSKVQISVLVGTGAGYFNGETEQQNIVNAFGKLDVVNGMTPMWIHARADIMFKLPKDFQLGAYVRYSLIPAQALSFMAGIAARYIINNDSPYKFYAGLALGWGRASTTFQWGTLQDGNGNKIDNFRDSYHIGSLKSLHIQPQFGFVWLPSQHFGLAIDISLPMHFDFERYGQTVFNPLTQEFTPKNGFGFHMDLSIGPVFRF